MPVRQAKLVNFQLQNHSEASAFRLTWSQLEPLSLKLRGAVALNLVRMHSIGFHPEHVFVRFTVDDWNTFEDTPATHVLSETWEHYFFSLLLPKGIFPGLQVSFAVCCEDARGNRWWHNNDGENFRVEITHTLKTRQVQAQKVMVVESVPELAQTRFGTVA